MKLWALMDEQYREWLVIGVYSTRALAYEAGRMLARPIRVVELTLDEMPKIEVDERR